LPRENLEQVIAQLDEALLLDNERFARACEDSLNGFRAAFCREPSLSGGGYPSEPGELEALLKGYFDSTPEVESSAGIRGVISPHIDFQRGGPVYAQVWQKAARAIEEIDLAIIFGTNHLGGSNLFALTRQNYATPFGILPTAVDAVDRLADAIGHDVAFEDELYHRNEHSIELALVWLHYLLRQRKCELVPVLCGSFEPFIEENNDPLQNEEILAVIDCLQAEAKNRRTLVIAAADLAHMGPAFGDLSPIEVAGRAEIGEADDALIRAMCSCDAQGFFSEIKAEEDARRVCGLSPIYLTLRVLGEARGEACGYAQCPADEMNASLVSICGVALE
jgi:AmmeMemoRadiSam system protein B